MDYEKLPWERELVLGPRAARLSLPKPSSNSQPPFTDPSVIRELIPPITLLFTRVLRYTEAAVKPLKLIFAKAAEILEMAPKAGAYGSVLVTKVHEAVLAALQEAGRRRQSYWTAKALDEKPNPLATFYSSPEIDELKISYHEVRDHMADGMRWGKASALAALQERLEALEKATLKGAPPPSTCMEQLVLLDPTGPCHSPSGGGESVGERVCVGLGQG